MNTIAKTSRPDSGNTNAKHLTYWITTVLTALLFAVPGGALLGHLPHFVEDMAHLGFPSYFLFVLGAWKLAGAATILAPRLPTLKEWAYAGMIFDATTAGIARAAVGDATFKIVVPLAIALLAAASWKLRPVERKLSIR